MGRNNITAIPFAFFKLALGYLALGILLGLAGSFQYLLPDFLKEKLGFQHIRPLHVYLVIAWIFTAAHGAIYYFVQKLTGRNLKYPGAAKFHFGLQVLISLLVLYHFFAGNFSGREYLEFPVWIGGLIALSWVPFAANVFGTLKPDYKNGPVYHYSWTVGIVFFLITLGEAYLWQFAWFHNNIIRDVTIQWKAMGSMVGAWNMLVYGSAMASMAMMLKDENFAKSKTVFLFFFVGFVNLMFNWGHHTYTVPAAPFVRNVAFIISMTELVLFANIIFKWWRGMKHNMQLKHKSSSMVLMFADNWILINLALSIAISVPALNYYTHGTHITVAHAMGATIGINTLLLFAVIYQIADEENRALKRRGKMMVAGTWITNISLLVFFTGLIVAGIIKILNNQEKVPFAEMMIRSKPTFVVLASSGALLMVGLLMMCIAAFSKMRKRRYEEEELSGTYIKEREETEELAFSEIH